jgi:hypothetical protein
VYPEALLEEFCHMNRLLANPSIGGTLVPHDTVARNPDHDL